jgi:hypothetical protein
MSCLAVLSCDILLGRIFHPNLCILQPATYSHRPWPQFCRLVTSVTHCFVPHADPLPCVCARAAATGACRGGLPGADDCDGWVSGALRAAAYATRECGALESGRGAARQPHPYRWMRLRACDACSRPSRRGGESGAGRLRRGRPGEKVLVEHMSLEDRWAPVQFDQ